MIALVLSSVALALSLIAVVLAIVVMRQSATAVRDLRRHRLAHSRAEGQPDPDRRERNVGPPEGHVERRTPDRYAPPAYEPRGEHYADEPTGELERPDLPTTMRPAVERPAVPDVRDVRRRS